MQLALIADVISFCFFWFLFFFYFVLTYNVCHQYDNQKSIFMNPVDINKTNVPIPLMSKKYLQPLYDMNGEASLWLGESLCLHKSSTLQRQTRISPQEEEFKADMEQYLLYECIFFVCLF